MVKHQLNGKKIPAFCRDFYYFSLSWLSVISGMYFANSRHVISIARNIFTTVSVDGQCGRPYVSKRLLLLNAVESMLLKRAMRDTDIRFAYAKLSIAVHKALS